MMSDDEDDDETTAPVAALDDQNDDLETDNLEAAEIERLARERRLRRGFRVAARRALYLARHYRFEEGPRGEREIACVLQAMAWRKAARDLRGKPMSELGPGLARATTVSRSPSSARRTG